MIAINVQENKIYFLNSDLHVPADFIDSLKPLFYREAFLMRMSPKPRPTTRYLRVG